MYPFVARVPIDHVLKLVSNLRNGDYERGDNFELVGAISGEVGALLKTGFTVGVMEASDMPSTIDECILMLSQLEGSSDVTTQAIPPWVIPVILKLLELLAGRM